MLKKEQESLCHGCEDCIGCVRGHQTYLRTYCSACEGEFGCEDTVYQVREEFLCQDCFLAYISDNLAELTDVLCDDSGPPEKFLFYGY